MRQSILSKILTIVLLCSITLMVTIIVYIIIFPKIGERFTEFYILDKNGNTDEYPTNLEVNKTEEIIVGIINHEYSPVNYTVQVLLDEEMLSKKSINIGNNETLKNYISFIPDKTGEHIKLEFQLYKENNFAKPYRELYLWVNVVNETEKI